MDLNNNNSLTATADPTSGRAGSNPFNRSPKFVRSKDRCHILTRTPIYDKRLRLLSYNLRFTAGENSFRPDELLKKHVKHVLIGFFIRRHIDNFTEPKIHVMTELPLSSEVTKFAKPLPANRFILHLQDRQDSSASFQHQVNMLRRDAMTIAADVYTIVYTNWFTELRSISYAVIDMTLDIEEQFILARNITKKAPWIRIICDRCDNVNKASIAFEAGADYVCCPTFSKDLLKVKFNPYIYKLQKRSYESIPSIISELLEARPNYGKFIDLISYRNNIKSSIPQLVDFLQKDTQVAFIYTSIEQTIYDCSTEVLHKLICVLCLQMLEEFYHDDTENVKFLKYEPVKQILIRAKFIEELLSSKTSEIDISWAFTLGVCSNIGLLYPYSVPSLDAILSDIEKKLEDICSSEPLFDTALNIAKCMESLDLEYVDGVIENNTFSRHEILFAYENALMWLSSFIEFKSKKFF
ncbi:MAG: hypothetical protein GX278_07155 [Aeromonadales bacterium]|nr:hypothetical protein [Aeromonadales bacterium]